MVTYYFSPFWDCGIVHAHIEDTRVVIFPWIIEHHIIYVIIMQWWVRIVHRRSCLVGLVRLYWVYCKPCTVAVQVQYTSFFIYYILQNHPQFTSVESSLRQNKVKQEFWSPILWRHSALPVYLSLLVYGQRVQLYEILNLFCLFINQSRKFKIPYFLTYLYVLVLVNIQSCAYFRKYH